jgi:hypothetical protein
MLGNNSFRVMPPGPTRKPGGPLRLLADGGSVDKSPFGYLPDIAKMLISRFTPAQGLPLYNEIGDQLNKIPQIRTIKEELPKWWGSDETADLRKGLRQTGLGAAYAFGPGLPMLPMLGAEMYDVFAKEEDEAKRDPTPGSFSWAEKQLGRDLFDPVEDRFALASGLSGLAMQSPGMYKALKEAPGAIGKSMNKASDWLGQRFPSQASRIDPSKRKFLEQASGIGAGAILSGTSAGKLAKTIEDLTIPGIIPELSPLVSKLAPKAISATKAASGIGDLFASAIRKAIPDDEIINFNKSYYESDPDYLKHAINNLENDPSAMLNEKLIKYFDENESDYATDMINSLSEQILKTDSNALGKADPFLSTKRLMDEIAYNKSHGYYEQSPDIYEMLGIMPSKEIESLQHPYQMLEELRDVPPETIKDVMESFIPGSFDKAMARLKNVAKQQTNDMALGGSVMSPAVKNFMEL